MRSALILLSITYIMSQFYRAFLAVLAPDLQSELGATEAQLSSASGMWFIIFALAQLPVGWALDHIGPRRTTSILVVLGAGGGAALFGLATTPWHLTASMGLIGIGCAPMLMASFYILARGYPAVIFATFAGIVIAVGNIGNIGASKPLVWMMEAFGWRDTMFILAAITAFLGILIWFIVRDPPKLATKGGEGVLSLLRIPALWLIFPLIIVNYAPAAAIRGLWIGPYLDQIHGASADVIGNVTLLMGAAMVLGSAVYGPLDRIFGTRKWVILGGSMIGMVFCLALASFGGTGIWVATITASILGIAGTAFPVVVAHAKSFVPPHLTGRGVTLINMFGIGGVGVLQMLSGKVFDGAIGRGLPTETAFNTVFFFFAGSMAIGAFVYLFSQDRLD